MKGVSPALLRYALSALLLGGVVASWTWNLPPLAGLARTADDGLYSLRPQQADPKVVFVTIGEKSINRLGRWPWPRETLARGVARLDKASVVVLDMVFSEAEGTAADGALARVLKAGGNSVCGFFLRGEGAVQVADPQRRALSLSALERVAPGRLQLPEAPRAEVSILPILRACTLNASFSTLADRDAIFRRYPLAYVYDGLVYPSLGVQALRLHRNEDLELRPGDGGLDAQLGDRRIPIDAQGMTRLNYYRRHAYRTVPFVDVFSGQVEPSFFEGKIAVVGLAEAGLADIRSTPVGALPGPLLHATFLSNYLSGDLLAERPRVEGLLILLLGLLPVAAVRWLPRVGWRLGVYGGVATATVAAALWAYASAQVWVGPFFPLLALLLVGGANEALAFRLKESESRFVQAAFSAYLSPVLLRELSRHPERLRLGGEERDVSVLFSDIRNFTSLSEATDSPELVQLLNEYFTPMTRIIQSHRGFVDKYIGDAIMAFWGAPVADPEHPERASRAALAMVETLSGLNASLRARGYPPVDIGVGINSGAAVVGNMGATERFNYTVIGDTVNLASRLEGLNKTYGTHILLSEYTTRGLGSGFLTRYIEPVRVKGKSEAVGVYELLANTPPNRDRVARFERARRQWREEPTAGRAAMARCAEGGDPVAAALLGREESQGEGG